MSSSTTWRAPGRVNLIGEHTDYNAGFALPFAIERACTAIVTVLDRQELVITSAQQPGAVQLNLGSIVPGGGGWADYVAGVVWALARLGATLPGLRIAVDSSVPIGSGLSSSAALTCSVTTALDDLLELGLSDAALLAVTRSVENDFVGAPTGGVDQLASLRCTRGHALLCDMRTLDVDQVPVSFAESGLALLVVDTRVEHQHVDGEYQQRRAGCERAARLLGLTTLRDLIVADLDAATAALPSDELRRYTRHVVTENQRVLDTVALLRTGRVQQIGPLLTASHRSLREDYRVTVPQLDVAVETLLGSGALGARMTGGGFGGCVIALLHAETVTAAAANVQEEFAGRGFARPRPFCVAPSRGAHAVTE